MRIVGGDFRGRSLATPRSDDIRPTTDRTREAVFNVLAHRFGDRVAGARVLDLFAGTGALGLEALSRGAHRVDLVEKDARAAAVASANAARVARATGQEDAVAVHRIAVDTYLEGRTAQADLIFMDPPYEFPEHVISRTLERILPVLAGGGLLILERSGRSPAPTVPAALTANRSQRYGDTVLWWYTATDPDSGT